MQQGIKRLGHWLRHGWDGFLVDWCRLWNTSSCGMAAALNIIVLPAVVAFALVVIFISRGFPQDTISSFIFFSTLYLFWSGLFIACRSVNGAVESGEWTYWVLGTRRTIGSYVWALVVYRTLQVLLVCFVFIAVVWGTTQYWSGYWTIAVTGPYLMPSSVSNGSFEAWDTIVTLFTDGVPGASLNLSHTLSSFAKWYFLGYFSLGLVLAGISGVFLGLFFSVLFKRSLQSVSFSVGFIMLITILSFVSMRPTRINLTEPKIPNNQGKELPSTEARFQSPCFLPVFYEWKLGPDRCLSVIYDELRETETYGSTTRACRLSKWMQAISHLFPQRYFFNIAHTAVPRLGYLSRGDISDTKREGIEKGKVAGDGGAVCQRKAKGYHCWCVFCLGLVPSEWHARVSVLNTGDDENEVYGSFWFSPGAFGHNSFDRAEEEKQFRESLAWDRDILVRIWKKVALWEIVALIVVLAAYGVIFYLLLRRPWLRRLR